MTAWITTPDEFQEFQHILEKLKSLASIYLTTDSWNSEKSDHLITVKVKYIPVVYHHSLSLNAQHQVVNVEEMDSVNYVVWQI